ncbi:MAG TPA: hypothetical protein VGR08_02605 [Thermomicrobiales bacterium]|nr:hypothetical protein [Thermomicrobiales bacterium]
MSTQRMIEFETTSEEGAARVNEAPGSAFGTLAGEAPDGVCSAYWRDQGRRFMDIEATRDLPRVTGECVEGDIPALRSQKRSAVMVLCCDIWA